MCYSRYEETILDKANNRKVNNIEVKEIERETSDSREEGSEDMNEESEYMLKQACVVVMLVKEVACLTSPTGLSLVKMVKEGCLKKVMERRVLSRKRMRTMMRMDHVRMILRKLYQRPAYKVVPGERQFLVQQLFIFFRIRSLMI